MVHSILNEKSSLNVASVLKAEQAYHEAKALASKARFIAGGGVIPSKTVGGGSTSSTASAPPVIATVVKADSGAPSGGVQSEPSSRKSRLLEDVEKIRREIQEILSDDVDSIDKMPAAMDKLTTLDSEVKELRQEVQKFSKEIVAALGKLEAKLSSLSLAPAPQAAAGGDAAKAAEKKEKKDDDDLDLFGSDDDEEDPEAEKLRQERLAAYADKKAKKPAVIAKSMIILDVKPWDDETDVKEMEVKVRSIEADGLVWGTSKFVEVAYGIKKLQITCVVEDDKVGTDFLEEQITGFDELVQSIDIVAFNKI